MSIVCVLLTLYNRLLRADNAALRSFTRSLDEPESEQNTCVSDDSQ